MSYPAPNKVKITDTKEYFFEETKEIVVLEVSDTSVAFMWRLRIGKWSTNWSRHYEGVLALRSQTTDNLYVVFMAYWTGDLPIEQPVLLKQGTYISKGKKC